MEEYMDIWSLEETMSHYKTLREILIMDRDTFFQYLDYQITDLIQSQRLYQGLKEKKVDCFKICRTTSETWEAGFKIKDCDDIWLEIRLPRPKANIKGEMKTVAISLLDRVRNIVEKPAVIRPTVSEEDLQQYQRGCLKADQVQKELEEKIKPIVNSAHCFCTDVVLNAEVSYTASAPSIKQRKKGRIQATPASIEYVIDMTLGNQQDQIRSTDFFSILVGNDDERVNDSIKSLLQSFQDKLKSLVSKFIKEKTAAIAKEQAFGILSATVTDVEEKLRNEGRPCEIELGKRKISIYLTGPDNSKRLFASQEWQWLQNYILKMLNDELTRQPPEFIEQYRLNHEEAKQSLLEKVEVVVNRVEKNLMFLADGPHVCKGKYNGSNKDALPTDITAWNAYRQIRNEYRRLGGNDLLLAKKECPNDKPHLQHWIDDEFVFSSVEGPAGSYSCKAPLINLNELETVQTSQSKVLQKMAKLYNHNKREEASEWVEICLQSLPNDCTVSRNTGDGLLSGAGDFSICGNREKDPPLRRKLKTSSYIKDFEKWKTDTSSFIQTLGSDYQEFRNKEIITRTQEVLKVVDSFPKRDMIHVLAHTPYMSLEVLSKMLAGEEYYTEYPVYDRKALEGRYSGIFTSEDLRMMAREMDSHDYVRTSWIHYGRKDYTRINSLAAARKADILVDGTYEFSKEVLEKICIDQQRSLSDFEAEYLYKQIKASTDGFTKAPSTKDCLLLIRTLNAKGFVAAYYDELADNFAMMPDSAMKILNLRYGKSDCKKIRDLVKQIEAKKKTLAESLMQTSTKVPVGA